MGRPRKTFARMLVNLAIRQFEENGWKLKKVMTARVGDIHRTLAECIPADNTIRVYPKLWGEGDPPLARSLLHELIGHMLLGYGGSEQEEQEVEWWEREIWRNLDQPTKDRLARMIEAVDE